MTTLWLTIPLLAAAAIALGWLLQRPFAAPLDALERLFVSFALGTAVLGSLALLLAQFGRFALPTLAALAALIAAALLTRCYSLSVIRNPLSVIRYPLSVIRNPTSVIRHPKSKIQNPKSKIRFPPSAALLLWLPFALWLFFRPHEFIVGAADAGVYTNLAAEIAQNGRIHPHDPLLANLDPALYDDLLRPTPNYAVATHYLVPAFFVTDTGSGRLTPQFYPLHPVWQAVAFATAGALGGGPDTAVHAALALTGLWALAGALAVYLAARHIAGWPAATLALAGLSLNALQVWFARYPTTEMLSQFWLWTGLWAAGAWLGRRTPPRLWALLGGVALGQFFLVRIDALFLLPLLALLLLWLWLARYPARGWFAAPLLAHIAWSLAYGWWWSRPYFMELAGFGLALLQQRTALLAAAALLGLLALAAAVWLWRQRGAAILPRLARWRRPVLGALAAALLLLTAYAWFIRPALPAPPAWQDTYSGGLIPFTDNENLPRLGWYLSPLGVWLGALGIAWLVWRANAKTAVLLAVALFYTIFYLASIRANPHQVYAARRYVMAALPLFTLGTAVLLTTLYRTGVQEKTFRNAEMRKEPQRDAKNLEISLRLFASSLRSLRSLTYAIRNPQSAIRLLTLLLTLAWLASTAWAARGFVSQVDYRGVIAQLDAVNAQLEPRSVLLFADPNPIGQGDFWGTPLKFLYGHAVFTLRDPAAAEAPLLVQTIESWQNNGRTVYWIGSPAWLDAAGLPYQPRLTATLASAALEGVYDHKPQAVLPVRWQLAIVEIDDVNNASGANESR